MFACSHFPGLFKYEGLQSLINRFIVASWGNWDGNCQWKADFGCCDGFKYPHSGMPELLY